MSVLTDLRHHRRCRAAEGYLELLTVYADRWLPDPSLRDKLARRAIQELEGLPDRRRWRAEKAYLRGQALRTMERYAEAIEFLDEAAKLQPINMQIQLAMGWCYKRVNRLDLAIQALEQVIEAYPDEGIVHYNLACYWSLVGNKGLALQYLTQSFDLDPNYREMVAAESDFDGLRDDPDFQMLISVVV